MLIQVTTVYVWHNNHSHVTVMSCVDNNVNSDEERIVFAWYQLLVMFLFPVVVILYCYVIVIRVLWRSTKEHARMTSAASIRFAPTFVSLIFFRLTHQVKYLT
jgi:hypothetical protein